MTAILTQENDLTIQLHADSYKQRMVKGLALSFELGRASGFIRASSGMKEEHMGMMHKIHGQPDYLKYS